MEKQKDDLYVNTTFPFLFPLNCLSCREVYEADCGKGDKGGMSPVKVNWAFGRGALLNDGYDREKKWSTNSSRERSVDQEKEGRHAIKNERKRKQSKKNL